MKKKNIPNIKRLQTNTLRKVLAVLIVAVMLFALLPTLPIFGEDIPQITAHQFSALVSEIQNGLSEAELIERGGASEASGKPLKAKLVNLTWGAAAQYWVEGYENYTYTVCVNSALRMEESTDNVIYSGFDKTDNEPYIVIDITDVPTLSDDYLLTWGRVAAYDKTTGKHYNVVVAGHDILEQYGANYTVHYQAQDDGGNPIGGEFTLAAKVSNASGTSPMSPTKANVYISPSTEYIEKGTSLTLCGTAIYVMNMTNGQDNNVTYSITSAVTDSATTIDPSTGVLSVGDNETAKEITVRATSNLDTVKYAEAKINIINKITLTYGSDANGSITEWMLVGDANRDGVIDNLDHKYITAAYGRDEPAYSETQNDPLAFEACDIFSNGSILPDDASVAIELINGTRPLPDKLCTFRVVDMPNPYYAISGVSVNGNALEIPEGFNSTKDTTADGITYTVAVNRYGETTVSGESLAENDVQFTHKKVEIEYFAGSVANDEETAVYDGKPHAIGRVFLERNGEELTDSSDMLYYLSTISDWYVSKDSYLIDDKVDDGPGSGWSGVVATEENVLSIMQNSLDYFTDFNNEELEYTDAGQYYFRASQRQWNVDPRIPRVASDATSGTVACRVLTITKRPITITASTSDDLTKYTISGDGLAESQEIKSITTDTSTTGNTVTNTVSAAVIIDAKGNDVTANYDITYVPKSYDKMVQVRVGIYITNDNGQYPNFNGMYYPISNLAGYKDVETGGTATLTQAEIEDILGTWANKYDIDEDNSLYSSSTVGTPSDAFPDNTELNRSTHNANFVHDITKFIYLRIVLKDKEEYTIVYDGNGNDGGIVPTDSNIYKTGDKVTIPTDVPTKTGYTFKCWKVNPEYQPGDTFIFDTVHANKANESNVVTLTAQWTSNTPKTGDNSNIYLLAGLMIAALSGAVILLIVSKNKNKA